jgi:hypothetical protein
MTAAAPGKRTTVRRLPSRRLPGCIAIAAVVLAGPLLSVAADERPTPTELSRAVSLALDPDRASSRDFRIEIVVPASPPIVWNGKQLRKTVGGRRRILTVFTDPPSVAGFAMLATERSRENDAHWMYVPPVRRVRRLVYEGRHENFLGTDFSVGDFGFLELDATALQVIDRMNKDGRETWAVKENWSDPTGYSHILTWVTTDTHIPLRREYFYAANAAPWKIDTRDNVVSVNGVPTPMTVTATSVQQGSRTVMTFDNVEFDRELEDSMFEPSRLGSALERIQARARPAAAPTEGVP